MWSWASGRTTAALAVLTEKVVSLSETQNPDLVSSPRLEFLKQQHCLPFYFSKPLFKISVNTPISIYSITISATHLPAVALQLVGSMWQVNDNYYITLLKFRLIGIRDQFCLISLPPSCRRSDVSFPLEGTNSLLHCNTYFVSGPSLLGNSSHGSPQSIPT